MIKIFRNVRQRLLTENKFSKYLLYAIGEIVLVVIGILIALQINDWSQKNKNDQLANVYLMDFRHDLETDIETLTKRININKIVSKTADSIFLTLATKNKLSNEELLNFYNQNGVMVAESYFIPEKITIRQFESGNNAHLISSKTLKDNLFKYYSKNDRNEMNNEKSVQLYQHLFYSKEIIQPLLSGDIIYIIEGSTLGRPNLDLNDLRMNTEYIWSIGAKKNTTENQTLRYENIKAMAEDLIKMIDSEFESQQ
jgi:hypothetical protein